MLKMNLLPRILYVLLLVVTVASCKSEIKQSVTDAQVLQKKDSLIPAIQPLFDSADVTGAIIVYDPQKQIYYSNDFSRCDKGFLPASTFKILNSLIALETGIVENDSTVIKWNGEKRRLAIWERDLVFRDAFHLSCVPCYQEIARKIGVDRMLKYLKRFDYGNMNVDSASIDVFWLEGESKITQRQQITFLEKFYTSELGVSKRTEEIMKRIMVVDSTEEYKLSGKTGWAIRNQNNIGWFVGYIEKNNEVFYFATNIEPKESFNMDMFPKIRKDISQKALSVLGIIN